MKSLTQKDAPTMTNPLEELKPGLTATVEIVVGTRDTAAHVGSGKIGVLATPILVTLMETAALQAVERFMPPGQQTVGTRLEISHTAATPVGMRVRAQAELVQVEGRKLTFKLHAEDEGETIGGGLHERLIISVERFDQRMQKKIELRGRAV
jgi:fluoroacetyl-CoA thioesterase